MEASAQQACVFLEPIKIIVHCRERAGRVLIENIPQTASLWRFVEGIAHDAGSKSSVASVGDGRGISA
eukprot:3792213-Prorocentrum_lima.AAC.1